jgi:ribonuclease HI
MWAIFVALIQIRARRPGRYLIVTDSMSSLRALQTRRITPRAHSLVYEIMEACWWLKNNGYKIHMMWIPSHLGVRGNERAYQLAGVAVENGIE